MTYRIEAGVSAVTAAITVTRIAVTTAHSSHAHTAAQTAQSSESSEWSAAKHTERPRLSRWLDGEKNSGQGQQEQDG